MNEVAVRELVGARPEREWEDIRDLVAEVGEGLTRYRDCGDAEKLLTHVWRAHGALDRLEHALQSAHLACCVLPGMQAPDELALAVARLSWQRVGALVVVEQQQSLDEYIARGTPLDAQLSASLLESLFYPGSALHDGAAVVRGTRVMAAGVFLPVTAERRDPAHGRLLGARHRAALGISRITDALVFVVSEETGEVSVALHGLLHPGVHIEAILRPQGTDSGHRSPRPASPADPSRPRRLRSVLRWFTRGRARSAEQP